jgi:hypothetical protein
LRGFSKFSRAAKFTNYSKLSISNLRRAPGAPAIDQGALPRTLINGRSYRVTGTPAIGFTSDEDNFNETWKANIKAIPEHCTKRNGTMD